MYKNVVIDIMTFVHMSSPIVMYNLNTLSHCSNLYVVKMKLVKVKTYVKWCSKINDKKIIRQ